MQLSKTKNDVLSAEHILIGLKIDAMNALVGLHPELVIDRAVLLGQRDRLSVLLKKATLEL